MDPKINAPANVPVKGMPKFTSAFANWSPAPVAWPVTLPTPEVTLEACEASLSQLTTIMP